MCGGPPADGLCCFRLMSIVGRVVAASCFRQSISIRRSHVDSPAHPWKQVTLFGQQGEDPEMIEGVERCWRCFCDTAAHDCTSSCFVFRHDKCRMLTFTNKEFIGPESGLYEPRQVKFDVACTGQTASLRAAHKYS